jgi:hypothetical protein
MTVAPAILSRSLARTVARLPPLPVDLPIVAIAESYESGLVRPGG